MIVCSLSIRFCFQLHLGLTCLIRAGSLRQTRRGKASLASKKFQVAYSSKVSQAIASLCYSPLALKFAELLMQRRLHNHHSMVHV